MPEQFVCVLILYFSAYRSTICFICMAIKLQRRQEDAIGNLILIICWRTPEIKWKLMQPRSMPFASIKLKDTLFCWKTKGKGLEIRAFVCTINTTYNKDS